MDKKRSHPKRDTTRKLVAIESKDRLTSQTINALSNNPELLKDYLESSMSHTFSELMFRLTHEIYAEKKARQLWDRISKHKAALEAMLHRDVGILVAALDYLTYVTHVLSSPKIIDDLRIEEAASMATRDSLTGLYMRQVFDFSLNRMVVEHDRYHRTLSLLLADIDDFKEVNDRLGHQAGDDVLRRMGKLFQQNIRKADFGARYGGEELAVILPETPIVQAVAFAEKLRETVARHFAEKGPPVTLSIGVASIQAPAITTALELVRSADTALYAAKNAGKNSVRQHA